MISRTRTATAMAALVAGLGLWLTLAPMPLGGPVHYLKTTGASMRPALAEGDLVLLRPDAAYPVGEIVAYRTDGGALFLHRIVDRDGARYVLKGDANGWLDGVRPEHADILGAVWLHVPGGGRALDWLVRPDNAATGTFALAVLGGTGLRAGRRRRARAGGRSARRGAGLGSGHRTASGGHAGRAGGPLGGLLGGLLGRGGTRARERGGAIGPVPAVLGAVALVALAVGVAAARAPLTVPAERELLRDHTGVWSYEASARPGTAYPEGQVRTGAPLYLDLVERLDVSFAYELVSDLPADVRGDVVLTAAVSDANGWRRAVELGPAEPFTGSRGALTRTLDLRPVSGWLSALESETGIPGLDHKLTLTATVRAEGTLGGAPMDDVFEATMPFRVEPLLARLDREGIVDDATTVSTVTEPATNRLSAGPVGVPVSVARPLSGALLVAALLGALLWTVRLRRGGEAGRIQARYGARIVPVSSLRPAEATAAVEVERIADLVRIADRIDQPVLHLPAHPAPHVPAHPAAHMVAGYMVAGRLDEDAAGDRAERYAVVDGTVMYWCELETVPSAPPVAVGTPALVPPPPVPSFAASFAPTNGASPHLVPPAPAAPNGHVR